MANTLRKVDYYYVMLPNRAGQGAKVMAALAAEGVNLLAFSGFPSAARLSSISFPRTAHGCGGPRASSG